MAVSKYCFSFNNVHTVLKSSLTQQLLLRNNLNVRNKVIFGSSASFHSVAKKLQRQSKYEDCPTTPKPACPPPRGALTDECPPQELTVGEKVAEAGKTASYMGVFLFGAGVTGFIFYLIGKELFSSESPSGVYGKALKECLHNHEILRELGEPIKGHGEMTRRGRARHVAHMEFEREGIRHMRVNFHLKGSLKRAVAQAEVKQNEKGKFDFRYILVETEEIVPRTIVVLDRR